MKCASYRIYAVFNARNGEAREVWFDPSENSKCLVGCTVFYTRSARVNPQTRSQRKSHIPAVWYYFYTLYNLPSFLLSITQYGSRRSYVGVWTSSVGPKFDLNHQYSIPTHDPREGWHIWSWATWPRTECFSGKDGSSTTTRTSSMSRNE